MVNEWNYAILVLILLVTKLYLCIIFYRIIVESMMDCILCGNLSWMNNDPIRVFLLSEMCEVVSNKEDYIMVMI